LIKRFYYALLRKGLGSQTLATIRRNSVKALKFVPEQSCTDQGTKEVLAASYNRRALDAPSLPLAPELKQLERRADFQGPQSPVPTASQC
jgi:hypothetical protein